MPTVTIPFLALLLAAIIHMALGALWYGKFFQKSWMREMGHTKASIAQSTQSGMWKSYAIAFFAGFLLAYVFAHIIAFVNANSFSEGFATGFWMWLGFIATTMVNKVLWEEKSWKLWAIDSGYYLTSLLILGPLFALW